MSHSLELWQRHGAHLLMVQPFMDQVIVGGEGCELIDADGRRILDLAAGQFCSILGHDHPKFRRRLMAQADRLVHLGDQYVSPEVLRAAERLAEIAPGNLSRVLFLSTGSEANECAMRMAKRVTGRTGMLAYSRGYYGVSLATRTLSSISEHPGAFDFQPTPAGHWKLLTALPGRCPVGQPHASCTPQCLDASLELVGDNLHAIAAVIVEPVISAGGMIFPSLEYLHALQARARSAGALLIVDEAQTGLGRCGRWFDCENLGLQPDILVLSKTAGNGYPAAAVIASDDVAGALEDMGFSHLSSHQNDPLCAAAIHAVIDILEEEGLVSRSAELGAYFLARLRELQARHELVHDVRGRGLMIGMELRDQGERPIAFELAMLCEQRGVHLTFSYYEPVMRIIPPLVITKPEIDRAVAVMDEALSLLRTGPSPMTELMPRNERSGPYVRRSMGEDSPLASTMALARKVWRTSPQQWVRKLRTLV